MVIMTPGHPNIGSKTHFLRNVLIQSQDRGVTGLYSFEDAGGSPPGGPLISTMKT